MSFHLLHCRPDVNLLASWAVRHNAWREHQTLDLGDSLHGLLRATFGTDAPQPFRYIDDRQGLVAYTSMTAAEIEARARSADRKVSRALGLITSSGELGYALRPFPLTWAAGTVLGFDVRVRPTVRDRRGEQDAFLRAVSQSRGAPVQRDEVYREWLRSHLNARDDSPRERWHGAVDLLDVSLSGFSRIRVVRRLHAGDGERRRARAIDGPDAILTGRLRVRDQDAFSSLLSRGVGRHRSFGFGMILLKRC